MPTLSNSSGLAFDDWTGKLCYRTSHIERKTKSPIAKGYYLAFGQTTTVEHDWFYTLVNTNNTPVSMVFFYFESDLPQISGSWTALTKRKMGYATYLYVKLLETYKGLVSDLHISTCGAWPLWKSIGKRYPDCLYVIYENSHKKVKITPEQMENYAKEPDKGGCCSKVQDTRFAIIF